MRVTKVATTKLIAKSASIYARSAASAMFFFKVTEQYLNPQTSNLKMACVNKECAITWDSAIHILPS